MLLKDAVAKLQMIDQCLSYDDVHLKHFLIKSFLVMKRFKKLVTNVVLLRCWAIFANRSFFSKVI